MRFERVFSEISQIRGVLFLICLLLLLGHSGLSQTRKPAKEENKLLLKARKHLAKNDYKSAKHYYNQLLEIAPDNEHYNFEQGLCYYNSSVDKDKSVVFFEKAVRKSVSDTVLEVIYQTKIGEALYYLGRAYQYVGRFDEAILAYNDFRHFIKTSKQGTVLARDVSRYIEECNYGKEYYENVNENITIENLGDAINSEFPEYAPVIKGDASMIIFCARKKGSTGGKFYHDDKYYEDIYMARIVGKKWTRASKFDSSSTYISSKINTKKHDAPITYSVDEKKLFIYRQNHVWVSEYKNGKWKEPVKLSNNINARGWGAREPSVYMTADEQTLFVVSNRKNGFGGLDIYKSTRQPDGEWGLVENIGPTINTIYDEDAPFLSPDGRTLYFSSNGHKTVGGYDIFKSKLGGNGQWSEPVNMGAPINTAGDDIYFVTNHEGNVGYYASSRFGGFGDMDVYKIFIECTNLPLTEVRGRVLAGQSQRPIGAKIKVTNKQTGEDMGAFTADPATGKYLMVLPPETEYHMSVETDNYLTHQEDFTLPKQCDYFQMYQEVQIKYLRDSLNEITAQKGHFHDAFFNISEEAAHAYMFREIVEMPSIGIRDTAIAQMTIASIIRHNDETPAKRVNVFLANMKKEIIHLSTTDNEGYFRFHNLNPDENYFVLIDAEDAITSYYGPDSEEPDITIIGDIYRHNLPGDDHNAPSQPLDNIEILMVDRDMKILNKTVSKYGGHYRIENLPLDQALIDSLNETEPFAMNIDMSNIDPLLSAFIRTINKDVTEFNYKEYIEIFPIEKPELPILPGPDVLVFKNILFDFDKSFLRNLSQQELDRIYGFLASFPQVAITVDGHTDWIGTDQYNMGLSERRALSAVDYLKNKGLENNRIDYRFFGESKPVTANAGTDGTDDPLGRQLNRRCEFRFYSQKQDLAYAVVMNF